MGVERGPATPAPEVGVGTNGSAVGVTGDIENTGSFILISYICLLLLLYCCIMNQVFIDLIATDASAAGTVQPGTVKCQYSACVRKSNIHTFTHVCFCSSCMPLSIWFAVRFRSAVKFEFISRVSNFLSVSRGA